MEILQHLKFSVVNCIVPFRRILPLSAALALMLIGAAPVRAQSARVTIDKRQATIETILQEIESQTDYLFINNHSVKLDRRVDVSAENESVASVLKTIFNGTGTEFILQGRHIVLTDNVRKKAQPAAPKAEERSGRIVDAQGAPIVGATVVLSGTTLGTTTDSDGRFTIRAARGNTLELSCLGYTPARIAVGDKMRIDVTLQEDAGTLDDIVVIGYGQQKRVNVTGAVGTISGQDLNNRPVTNTAAALQGADPSLLLTMGSGSIEGKDYSVRIRGAVSLNSGSPLILVDGIETSLTQVNPNDIESVSVLKDASACAIYGAKASAGVVLINTKSGKSGELKVTYNGRYGVSWNTTSTDFVTEGYSYTNFINEFANNQLGYDAWQYTDDEMQMLYDRRNDRTENPDRPWVITDDQGKFRYLGNFDWYGYIFKRSRPETEHNVTVTGGNDRIDYYVSGRYLYREGLFSNNTEDIYNGYSFRTKINAKVTPWLRYSGNISFEKSNYRYGGFWEQDGSEGHASNGILFDVARNTPPMAVPINPDGTVAMFNTHHMSGSAMASGRIGVFTDGRNRNKRIGTNYTITNRLVFDLTSNKELKLTADYTYKRNNKFGGFRSLPTSNVWNATQDMIIEHTNGSIYDFYQESRYFADNQVANVFFDYSHSWSDHNFSAVAGGNFEDFRSSKLSVRQKGSISENLDIINYEHGTIDKANLSNTSFRTLGFFGRVNYDYKGKYLLEVSARYDGTSRFAAKNRWAFNPSASIGWRLSEEEFWEPMRNWWDNAKVRFSYGSLGNQQVSNYYYIDKISTGHLSYTFDGEKKAGYASASDPITENLTWETVITYNLGADLGFLRNRLNVSADFYIRDTKDMLTKLQTLPTVYGATTPKANCANLRTKGYEISVSWNDKRIVAGKPFRYGISASLGDYKTTITKYKNDERLLSDHYVGKTLGDIWGYKTGGLFKTDEEAAQYQATINDKAVNQKIYGGANSAMSHLMAGDVKFLDLDGNNIINQGSGTLDDPGDRRIIGNDKPRYLYSLRGNLNWNGFDFAVFFQGVGKINWIPDSSCLYFWGPYDQPIVSFIEKGFEKLCWSEDNTDAYFPRRRAKQLDSAGALNVKSDRYLQDASYLRLKNITLGYTIPINKRFVEKLRIYVSGENLAYWSPLKRYCKTIDPEVATTNATNDCLYPYSRTFSAGIDITF